MAPQPSPSPAAAVDDEDTPFVTIDGRRFYADRPYLNAMAGTTTPPDDEADEEANGGVQLFSRARLVASLAAEEGLEACILTTYAVELPDLEEEFPALFSPQSRVPTLLLHGDKRVRRRYAEAGRHHHQKGRRGGSGGCTGR